MACFAFRITFQFAARTRMSLRAVQKSCLLPNSVLCPPAITTHPCWMLLKSRSREKFRLLVLFEQVRAWCRSLSVDQLINLILEGTKKKYHGFILVLLLFVTIFSLKPSCLAFPYTEITLKLKARYVRLWTAVCKHTKVLFPPSHSQPFAGSSLSASLQ